MFLKREFPAACDELRPLAACPFTRVLTGIKLLPKVIVASQCCTWGREEIQYLKYIWQIFFAIRFDGRGPEHFPSEKLNSNVFLDGLIVRRAKIISVMFTLKVTFREIIAAGILTAVLIKSQVSLCMRSCKLVISYRHNETLAPECGGSTPTSKCRYLYYRSTPCGVFEAFNFRNNCRW
jgi:hypothetical protein